VGRVGAWRARVRVKVKRKRRRMAAPSFQVMGEKSRVVVGGCCCGEGFGFEGLRSDCCGGGVVVGCGGCGEAEREWRGVVAGA